MRNIKGAELKTLDFSEAAELLPFDDLSPWMAKREKEFEESSPFKKGQRVRVCQAPNLSVMGKLRLRPLPHNHNDPTQHWESRVIGWNCLGQVVVAMPYGSNPHFCSWSYLETSLSPLPEGDDWLERSAYKPGSSITFAWDLIGFPPWSRGEKVSATVSAAHINCGDWIIEYPRDKNETMVIRVLNEKQMLQI